METVNQEKNVAAEEVKNEEVNTTFTQEDVDRIVGERLAREREKFSDYKTLKEKAEKFDQIEEESKSELQKAQELAANLQAELDSRKKAEEIRGIRDKVAAEMDVPSSLLSGETEEECKAQAEAILEFAKPGC